MRRTLIVLVCLLSATQAFAQDKSHWGVEVKFVPNWEVPATFRSLFEAEPVVIDGSEFRIGIIRGKDLGGDWGVSYVKRKIDDGSRIGGLESDCQPGFGCFNFGDEYVYHDAEMVGVFVHKFTPFATIKRRLQIGLVYGGGIASFKGTATHTEFGATNNGQGNLVETVDAKETFVIEQMPLGDVEIAVAGIVAPGLKVRASGGISFPGKHTFAITINYLIGK
jgi:hypothetical protein